MVWWPFVAWRLPTTTVDAGASPRGPPRSGDARRP
jgi:hypothetical protein